MKSRIDVAVIGAGIVGSAAALRLADAGARVRLFEQFALGHLRGSSHGPTRLYRLAYFEHSDYVPLMRRSLELWSALENRSGATLLAATGVLEAGPQDGFLVPGVRRAAAIHNLPLQALTAAQTRARFPWFRLPAGSDAVFEPTGGFIYADRALRAQIDQASRAGVALHAQEPVFGWGPAQDRLAVDTIRGRHLVDRIVIAPGAWAASLLGADVAPVAVAEKSLFWFAPGDRRFRLGRGFAPFAVEAAGARMFYGFPAIDEDGVKVGEHTGERRLASPEARLGAATQDERDAAISFVRDFALQMPTTIGKEKTCLYELSPDGHFLIGRHAAEPRLSFAAGLSGHGFKFAPMIGEALAALALDLDPPLECAFLDAARFGKSG